MIGSRLPQWRLREASRHHWRPLRTAALSQLRATSQPTLWEVGFPPRSSAQPAGPSNSGGDWRKRLLVEWRGLRARVYPEGARGLEVGTAGGWRRLQSQGQAGGCGIGTHLRVSCTGAVRAGSLLGPQPGRPVGRPVRARGSCIPGPAL